jgi:hypothetical protein
VFLVASRSRNGKKERCESDHSENLKGRESKGKGVPEREGVLGEWRYSSTHSLTSALDAGEWSASRPGCFNPGTLYSRMLVMFPDAMAAPWVSRRTEPTASRVQNHGPLPLEIMMTTADHSSFISG